MNIPEYILKLAERGVEISIEPFIENKGKDTENNRGVCIAVGGFYKNGKIRLCRTGGFADFESRIAIGRYGVLGEVATLEDMVELNFSEWRRYEAKEYPIDPMWASLLEEYGCIRKVVETKYIPWNR